MLNVAFFFAAAYIFCLFVCYFAYFLVRAVDSFMLGEYLKFIVDVLFLIGPIACGYIAYIIYL